MDFVIPAYYLPAIVNGDYSGLTDDEVANIDLFLDGLPEGLWDFAEEEYFAWGNDINNLGGNVIDCTLVVI